MHVAMSHQVQTEALVTIISAIISGTWSQNHIICTVCLFLVLLFISWSIYWSLIIEKHCHIAQIGLNCSHFSSIRTYIRALGILIIINKHNDISELQKNGVLFLSHYFAVLLHSRILFIMYAFHFQLLIVVNNCKFFLVSWKEHDFLWIFGKKYKEPLYYSIHFFLSLLLIE